MTDEKIEPTIRRSLWLAALFMFIALAVPVISFMVDFRATNPEPYFWFQRSGSITVLLAVIAEYVLLRVRGDINPPPSSYVAEMKWNEKYGIKYSASSVSALTLVVFGTLIWGYGDIPFRALS